MIYVSIYLNVCRVTAWTIWINQWWVYWVVNWKILEFTLLWLHASLLNSFEILYFICYHQIIIKLIYQHQSIIKDNINTKWVFSVDESSQCTVCERGEWYVTAKWIIFCSHYQYLGFLWKYSFWQPSLDHNIWFKCVWSSLFMHNIHEAEIVYVIFDNILIIESRMHYRSYCC